jgi:hypothetical protein
MNALLVRVMTPDSTPGVRRGFWLAPVVSSEGAPSLDWSYRHVWYYLPLFYFIGIVVSWRRYR